MCCRLFLPEDVIIVRDKHVNYETVVCIPGLNVHVFHVTCSYAVCRDLTTFLSV